MHSTSAARSRAPAISFSLCRLSALHCAGALLCVSLSLFSALRRCPLSCYTRACLFDAPALSPALSWHSPPNFPRVLGRMAPVLSSTLLPSFPPYCAAIRQCSLSCSAGAALLAAPALCALPRPGALFVQRRRSFWSCSGAFLSHHWCAVSRCDGCILRAAPAISFVLASVKSVVGSVASSYLYRVWWLCAVENHVWLVHSVRFARLAS